MFYIGSLKAYSLCCAVSQGDLDVGEVLSHIDFLNGAELLLGEGFVSLLPQMQCHHDMFAGN